MFRMVTATTTTTAAATATAIAAADAATATATATATTTTTSTAKITVWLLLLSVRLSILPLLLGFHLRRRLPAGSAGVAWEADVRSWPACLGQRMSPGKCFGGIQKLGVPRTCPKIRTLLAGIAQEGPRMFENPHLLEVGVLCLWVWSLHCLWLVLGFRAYMQGRSPSAVVAL